MGVIAHPSQGYLPFQPSALSVAAYYLGSLYGLSDYVWFNSGDPSFNSFGPLIYRTRLVRGDFLR